MKIGFLINDIRTEKPGFTTARLSMAATQAGHQAWLIPLEDLSLDSDGRVVGKGRRGFRAKYKNRETYLNDLRKTEKASQRLILSELDVLMLRNNPSDDAIGRSWAEGAGILFGRQVLRGGVMVLNDPDGLSRAANKMYLQEFPEEVRPRLPRQDPVVLGVGSSHRRGQSGGFGRGIPVEHLPHDPM